MKNVVSCDIVLSVANGDEIDEKQIKEFIRQDKRLQGKSILIKQNGQFSLYNHSSGEWKLTHGIEVTLFKFADFEIPHPVDCKPSFVRVVTERDENCVLHAIFGQWNHSKRCMACLDIPMRREKVHAVIVGKDNKQLQQDLIVEGIKELIISGRGIGAVCEIRDQYQRFLNKQKEIDDKPWRQFVEVLEQEENAVIKACIQKHHQLDPVSTLRDQFYDALNRSEGELYGRILSLPALSKAFQNYNQSQAKGFLWDSFISADVKNEYANFVGTSRAWLLPSELAIIAQIFDMKITCYPAHGVTPFIINSNASTSVTIQLDDQGHCEQLQKNWEVVAILKSRQISAEAAGILKSGLIPEAKVGIPLWRALAEAGINDIDTADRIARAVLMLRKGPDDDVPMDKLKINLSSGSSTLFKAARDGEKPALNVEGLKLKP